MGSLIGKIILFVIGQKLSNREAEAPAFAFPHLKRNLGYIVASGVLAFIFFTVGINALFYAAYLGLVSAGVAELYAVLAIAATATALAAVFGIVIYEIACEGCSESSKKKPSLADLNPKVLAEAFLDGFLSSRSSSRRRSNSCASEPFNKYYNKRDRA